MAPWLQRIAAAAAVVAFLVIILARRRPTSKPVRIVVHHRRASASASVLRKKKSARPHVNRSKPFALDTRSGMRAAAAVAVEGELIMTTSDWNGIDSAVNLASQLARFSLDRRLLLVADHHKTCARAQAIWPWLACGASSGIPGFERYKSTGVVDLWTLWSAKWLVLARLVELRVNVMMLDSDILMLADPYQLLHSSPLSRLALILPPEGARVNVGYVYARGATAVGGLPSMLWDVVRRLRLFVEQQTLLDRAGKPSVQGLWDQGLFSDALTSSVRGEHTYAFTWSHSPSAFPSTLRWPPAGFTNANASALLSKLWQPTSWTQPVGPFRAKRPLAFFPSLPELHAQRKNWLSFAPILWNFLRPLDPVVGIEEPRREARPDLLPGWLEEPRSPLVWARQADAATAASEAAEEAAKALATQYLDLVGAAPDWLHCTTGKWMMSAGWLSADKPVCAVLHLVESRSQFVHFTSLDTLKANRRAATAGIEPPRTLASLATDACAQACARSAPPRAGRM